MEPLKVFTARDLRLRAGELMQEAEAGRVALITKHGRPALLAIPFDEHLLQHGLHRAMALHLFEEGQVSLAQGARLAAISLEELISLLGESGIDVVRYSPDEIDAELKAAL